MMLIHFGIITNLYVQMYGMFSTKMLCYIFQLKFKMKRLHTKLCTSLTLNCEKKRKSAVSGKLKNNK